MRVKMIKCPLCERDIEHIEGIPVDQCIACRVNFDMLGESIEITKEGEDAVYIVKILVRSQEFVNQ